MTLSNRWFCPHCRLERTGDRLDMPCECMAKPQRQENRRLARLRVPRVSPRDTVRAFVVIQGGLAGLSAEAA